MVLIDGVILIGGAVIMSDARRSRVRAPVGGSDQARLDQTQPPRKASDVLGRAQVVRGRRVKPVGDAVCV
ncbi:hypothetical protein [Streptomyces thermoalcalitolerans]|uniref:Uncharacterized protein n=1 Tax=Streptomyces thermoalcalitolerans TaxID=65605 RepID=A0ABN1NG38_9ACTN